MSETTIRVGDRVRYRVGKGYGTGRVANIADGMASINTDAGDKIVNRKLLALTKTEEAGVSGTTVVNEAGEVA